MKPVRSVLPVALAGLVFLNTPETSAKDIVRHCDGHYNMLATLVDGRPPGSKLGWSFGRFSGKGHCGSVVPNRCRERARGKLQGCYREHWKVRWDRVRPQACTEAAGVQKYSLEDIKTVMEQTVCCAQETRQYERIVVNLYGITRGDRGCGSQTRYKTFYDPEERDRSLLLQTEYKMDCKELRKRICPKRTG